MQNEKWRQKTSIDIFIHKSPISQTLMGYNFFLFVVQFSFCRKNLDCERFSLPEKLSELSMENILIKKKCMLLLQYEYSLKND